jgi:ribosomal protein S21
MRLNVQVLVRHGDLEQAIRRLKKKVSNEHIVSDMRRTEFYTKPSQVKRIRHLRALNRERKVKALFG